MHKFLYRKKHNINVPDERVSVKYFWLRFMHVEMCDHVWIRTELNKFQNIMSVKFYIMNPGTKCDRYIYFISFIPIYIYIYIYK